MDAAVNALTHQIDIEIESTWPNEIGEILTENIPIFRLFEEERKRLLELYARDWLAYQNEQVNQYESRCRQILDIIEDSMASYDIIGFHCTRLCEDEIRDIENFGLTPSSVDFLVRRVQARVAAGHLSPAIAERLLRRNQGAASNRTGQIWFINGSSILREDEGGLYRLFRYWGGEAIYGLHEQDTNIGQALKDIGKPCIVAAVLPVEEYKAYSIAKALYHTFMRARGVDTDGQIGTEGYVKEPLSSQRILRVIRFDDPEFEKLTVCSRWQLEIA